MDRGNFELRYYSYFNDQEKNNLVYFQFSFNDQFGLVVGNFWYIL